MVEKLVPDPFSKIKLAHLEVNVLYFCSLFMLYFEDLD